MRAELKAIYREVERETAIINPKCKSCGRCCDFQSFDHQLWLTQFELALIIEESGLRRPVNGGVCPYQEDGLCTAYASRALGCRVFSCEANSTDSQELHERFLSRIRKLAEENGIDLYYGELLTSLQEIEIQDRVRGLGGTETSYETVEVHRALLGPEELGDLRRSNHGKSGQEKKRASDK